MIKLKHTFFAVFLLPFIVFGQCIEGDCQNGIGQYKLKTGTYTGSFFDNNINGEGSFVTRRGYSYVGEWEKGARQGFGKESFRKGASYEGNFRNNQRHGFGKASLDDNKFMKEMHYEGEWAQGSICGQGQLSYSRHVKYGRDKVIEQNTLTGDFINGVFQGRLTNAYSDELLWEPFKLKMSDFRKYQKLSVKERKKLKNPATIEGDFVISCECLGDVLLFEAQAIMRMERSWWSTQDIPTKTKDIVLSTMQKEFDIVEWHARALQLNLNKQKLPCLENSVSSAWEEMSLMQRECVQVRKNYSTETAWNPTKGLIKNKKIQDKWNNKIAKKLQAYEKNNKKVVEKIKKKASKEEKVKCLAILPDPGTIPVIPEPEIIAEVIPEEKEEVKEEKKETYVSQIIKNWKEAYTIQQERAKLPKPQKEPRDPKYFKPQFPRSQQLE